MKKFRKTNANGNRKFSPCDVCNADGCVHGENHANAFGFLNDKLEIACSNNESIKVVEIQKEGKKIQDINEFLNGSKIPKGCSLNE